MDPNSAEAVDIARAFETAAWEGDADTIRRLLLRHPDPDIRARLAPQFPNSVFDSPLALAAKLGHAECVSLLLPHSDPLWGPSHGGFSALAQAAANGRLECLNLLLPHSDPLAQDGEGFTAIAIAAQNSQTECARALLPVSRGALDKGTREGRTPLMLAVRAKALDIAKILLPGSNPHARDAAGKDALMHAANFNWGSLVELLAPVSDLSATNCVGHGALWFACNVESLEGLDALSPWLDEEQFKLAAKRFDAFAPGSPDGHAPRIRARLEAQAIAQAMATPFGASAPMSPAEPDTRQSAQRPLRSPRAL